MSFIAKNPLALPEVSAPPFLPTGTRGIFAGKDGFYQIDSDGSISKIVTAEQVEGRTFDGVIELQGNPLETDELNNLYGKGIYKVLYSVGTHNVAGILEVGEDSYTTDEYEEYWETQKFTNYNNECYIRNSVQDTIHDWYEWEKVSVSQDDIENKVEKENGKGLSTNDFTDKLKNKLESIPEGGTNITVDSELSVTSTNPVQNKVITAELNASIKMSEYVDLYDNIVEYFNGKSGFGAEFVKYDMDGFVTEPQTLIFTWGGFQSGDAFLDYQTVIFPEGDIYHRTKNYDEEWITPEELTNFWHECGWEKVSVSQTDLKAADKVPALKINPAIEIKSGGGYLNWEELTEMDVPAGISVIYSVDVSESTYEYGFVIKSYGDYEQLVVMCPNGEIREIHRDYDTWEWLEWTSPFNTQGITVDSELLATSENPVQNKVITKALTDKVSKENGKGLSSNDFTNALKTRLADSVIVSTLVEHGDSAKEYFNGKTGFGAEFIQWDEDGGVSDAQVLIFTWGERYVQNSTGYFEPGNYQSVIYPDGEVYYRTKLFEEEWTEAFEDPMYIEWKKVSVSQKDIKSFATKTDLDNAIGDIETSLENIIKKYGLGGDSV